LPPDPAPDASGAGRPLSRLEELTARARRVVGAPDVLRGPSPPAAAPAAPRGGERQAAGVARGAVYVGIDPGTATTGYGFVRPLTGTAWDGRYETVDFGVVETGPEQPMPDRLLALFTRLRQLIAAHRPAEAAVEKLFFGRNTTTAISVGQARGVVLLALAEAGVPVAEYTPAEVKQAVAGFGRAQKSQVQRMIQTVLDLPAVPQPDDAADALAIAICHLRLSHLRAAGLR
jgi:crossover junction endodeoxyribonuclease RuvC